MNRYLLLPIMFVLILTSGQAQVKIGSAGSPNANAVLELDGGTNKGLLLPKLNNAQIVALTTAPDGLVVYNSTDGFLYLRKNSAWQKVSDATNGGGFILPYSGTASTVGGAEFSITHTTTFGDAAYFNNTAGGAAITTAAGNNKFNMTSGNTGIGIPAGLGENPSLGKLVVRGVVGAVSAMFGDNTAGVSVMNNFPSIGFNYYYNAGSKAISTGFGSAFGQDPSTGRIYFSSSATSVTGAGTAMPLVDRLVVLANGNTGIAKATPLATLHVGRGSTVGGTAQFDGTVNSSHFNYNTTEETYIRGGKAASQVIINDLSTGNVRLAEGGGNVGIGMAIPTRPLSFPAAEGKKISLYPGTTGDVGLSVAPNELRMYSDNSSAVITMGYDNFSTGFKETFRINPWGTAVATNPASLNTNVENAAYFKTSDYYTGALKLIGTSTSTARLGLYAYASGSSSGLREYLSITDDGNVGINTTVPGFKLDIAGRMRLRNESAGVTAGFWLDGTTLETRGFIGTFDNDRIGFYGGGTGWGFLYDVTDGTLGIGTTQKATGYLVNIGGKVMAEEVRVQLRAAWPDYVFEKGYKKLTLAELENYVAVNKHLPNIPSAKEIEKDGLQLGEVQRKMLEKIEELTLYIVEMNKRMETMEKENKSLK